MPNYADRVERAREAMRRHGIDLLYLAPGANAQYLSGWRRSRPHFGNVNYPGGWIQGLFLGLKQGPILAVPLTAMIKVLLARYVWGRRLHDRVMDSIEAAPAKAKS